MGEEHHLTKEEFWGWMVADFFARFPQVKEWLDKLDNKPNVLRQWFAVLRPYSVEQLTEVADMFSNGHREPPKPYERDLWPAFLLTELSRIKVSRKLSRGDSLRVQCEKCQDTGFVAWEKDGIPYGEKCGCRT